MNSVQIIGRVANDPIVRRTAPDGMAVARFSVALGRGKDSKGNDRGTDYPGCVAFGKTAELIEQYVRKGHRVAISGHLQTGSYDKDGHKVYTTDIIVERCWFLETKASAAALSNKTGSANSYGTPNQNQGNGGSGVAPFPDPNEAPPGFSNLDDDDIPF